MNIKTLEQIIKNKSSKVEFAIVTNLENGLSEIYEPEKSLSKEFENYREQIENFFKLKKNGVIEKTEIFVETYIRPIKVIIVGAVHIAQYLVDFAKSLNFEISIIDPRGYFASEQRFPDMKIINKWPDEAFKEIETNENSALIALTHDPKIDDPALQHAINKKFYYSDAFTKNTIDKIGAGDAMLSLISMFLKTNSSNDLALLAGSLAASQSTQTLANKKVVNKIDLIKSLEHILK